MKKQREKLENFFKIPPHEYSPVAFWFWSGWLQEEKLSEQIEEMCDKGVWGAFMHARASLKTEYLSQRWWEIIGHVVRKAKQLGFHAWIYDEYAWPSGPAGSLFKDSGQPFSKVLAEGEANWGKGLNYGLKRVSGPDNVRLDFPEASGKIEAVLAVRETSEGKIKLENTENLRHKLGNFWQVPPGKWIILIFFQYSLPHRIDYLNPKTVAKFIEVTHEAYWARYGSDFGSVIPGSFFDEIHNDGRPFVWTEGLLDRFQEIKGYDLAPYLPALVFDAGKITDKIRCDYFDVVTTLYEKAWFSQLGRWCGQHGISLTGHTEEWLPDQAISQGDYFRTIRHLQIPGADNHCFRYRYPRRIDPIESKVVSSVAHLEGKRRVLSEAMGGAGWAITPQMLKYGANALLALGINMIVPHGFFYDTATPEAMDDYPPSWFYQNPYWKYFKNFADYISRLSYLLSQGQHVCDVAVLYPITSIWANTVAGKPTDMAQRIADRYHQIIRTLLAKQIDLDVVHEDHLNRAKIENGCIKIADETYRVLILPPLTTLHRQTAEKIETFFDSGGIVFSVETLPSASPEEGRDDHKIAEAMLRIFGLDSVAGTDKAIVSHEKERGGKAFFITNDITQIISGIKETIGTDIQVLSGGEREFQVLHRKVDSRDIYFLANGAPEAREMILRFRAQGRSEKWDPEDGSVHELTALDSDSLGTVLKLDFQPHQAWVVVFDPHQVAKIQQAKKEQVVQEQVLDGAWDFIVAPGVLDKVWQPSVGSSKIALPVMDFQWTQGEPPVEEAWKQIKVCDTNQAQGSCGRYLSPWRAKWITDCKNTHPRWDDNADKLFFRKNISIPDSIEKAWLCLTAVTDFSLFVNGKLAASGDDWRHPQTIDVTPFLRQGENTIAVAVKKRTPTIEKESELVGVGMARATAETIIGLLAEGEILTTNNQMLSITTDSSWKVFREQEERWNQEDFDDRHWFDAWERGQPPLQPWGSLPLPMRPLRFPITLWYRQDLPLGTKIIHRPKIKGDWLLYVDGHEMLSSKDSGTTISVPSRQKSLSQIMLRVTVNNLTEGLIEPITVECKPARTELIPWSEMGLAWYSGRGVYSKEFSFTGEPTQQKVFLALGRVKHMVEVWVNGKLVSVRLWEPYQTDITANMVNGKNRLDLVVSNLLANRMRWDIYDAVAGRGWNRYWHEDNIERDRHELTSGLFGPVKILVIK